MNYRSPPISKLVDLAKDIWDSIIEDTSAGLDLAPEQQAELRRRLAAHRVDPHSSIHLDQVLGDVLR